jgi:hypothetical protein
MFSKFSRKARADNVKNSSDGVAFRAVDLQLPKEKIPAGLKGFQTKWAPRYGTVEGHVNTKRFLTYAIGSSSKTDYSYRCEMGLFECVKEAWANHWNLRTSPEDWWFPVACRIAKAIDKAAKPGRYSSEKVRNLFVSHQGKEEIGVEVPVFNIYQVDYDKLFSCFSSEIQDRIKVPDFATQMQNDFSTSTPSQQIASQINLMASVQEFFSYHTGICGCGIRGLEMLGTRADWDRLVEKLQAVEKQLSPIASEIGLGNEWFRHVEYVFRNMAQSYSDPGSTKVKDFWADVLCVGKDWKYGPSGFGGHEVEAYNGWLIKFLTGTDSLWKENLSSPETLQELRGLNSVPMKVSLTYRNPVVSDESELRAGIMGFLLVEPEATFNHVPALQPNHVWAMMLPPKSPLRHA